MDARTFDGLHQLQYPRFGIDAVSGAHVRYEGSASCAEAGRYGPRQSTVRVHGEIPCAYSPLKLGNVCARPVADMIGRMANGQTIDRCWEKLVVILPRL